MVVGVLGDIVFQVTPDVVETVDNFVWSGEARWAVHERHGGDALAEFVGRDTDNITFDVYLSAFLGVNPMEEIKKIWAYEREGTTLPLTLGEHHYGRYRWGIQKHTAKPESWDNAGNMLSATVSVTLIEYLRD